LKNSDLVFGGYVIVSALAIGARVLTGRLHWETALLGLSTFGMILVCLVMFRWAPLL